MANQILASVLRKLSDIYRFKSSGKNSPNELEVDLPIQVVQDVSRMSAIGASIGPNDGFWISGIEITHVAVGVITFDASMRYAAGTIQGYPPIPSYDARTQWAWIYGSWCNTTDDPDLLFVSQSVIFSPASLGIIGTAFTAIPRLELYYGTTGFEGVIYNARYGEMWPVPLLLGLGSDSTDDAYIRCLSRSQNLGTIVNTFGNLIWVGPKGMPPPQMS